MRVKEVTFTGVTPLIMHPVNIPFADMLKVWQKNPSNREEQVKGDDRVPAWTWIGSCYHDGQFIGIPSDCIMAVLRGGGAHVATGKGNKTFKKQSQSGLVVMEPFWTLTTAEGHTIPWGSVEPLMQEKSFEKHVIEAKKLGIDLFIKRVPLNNTSRVIRVRPMFAKGWKISGTIGIMDETITDQVFQDIIMMAGNACGFGDWRPSAPKSPGPFGRCEAAAA